MYQKISADVKEKYYKDNFSNDGQRFVAWYLRNILFRDMNETRDEITDGQNDKQIDAVVIDNDKSVVHILQGKYPLSGQVDAEPLREVLSSWIQLRDLSRLQVVGNDKLQRKLSELATALEDDYEISFELITTSTLTEAAMNDLETFQRELSKLSENEDFDATISVIDAAELQRRYEHSLDNDNPQIVFTLDLTDSKYLPVTIADTQVIMASVPLKDCIKFPGIKDGTLFQKNVRQSLGSSNAVNKGIRQTILGDKHKDFFFFHNGITALCSRMELKDNKLKMIGLSVVNGCQSLNTILSCSETVKKLEDTSILFRFYEIPQRDRADRISIFTNLQSVVRPRDLRSNDKRVLAIKRNYEQKYQQGAFLTKRGEQALPEKDKDYVVDLAIFAKCLIAWHSQRPNLSYGETKIFDKYFETLFKNKEYRPENVYALNRWMNEIQKVWSPSNPLNLNETLLAMKAYAPYHHLYAVSMVFGVINRKVDRVPVPSKTYEKATGANLVDQIVRIAGRCLNTALKVAANRQQPENRVFSPQNWIKSKTSLNDVSAAIEQYFDMLPTMENMENVEKALREGLALSQEDFEYRLSAD
jgi:AIPR protein